MTKKIAPVARPALLIVGILLIAATLRAPITGIAPVLGMIRESFSLGTTEAGVLTTLPLLAFAVTSPFAVLVAREYGLERSLFGALFLMACGIVLRSLGFVWCLFLGTAIIGVGIAIANVLLPSLLKRDFPDRIASLTGAYSVTAGIAAALASAAAIPIAGLFEAGWTWALGSLVILPLMAMAAWLPQLAGHTAPSKGTATPPHGGRTWHSALAWQVTLFFGLNSLIYYVIVTWLPAILREAGYSAAAAGSLHGASQLATAIPGLVFGAVLSRFKDQKIIAVSISAITALSLLGLLVLPGWSVVWVALFGVGAGATFILALAFISLRTANAHQAAALSAMAQCVGYLVAAMAPPAAGFIHDRSHGWTTPLLICLALCGVMAAMGYRAGRPLLIFRADSIAIGR
ncbi:MULTISPECIES: MFS transporter [unclassified Beijerinckia]|uniref:MFS transporter n=1 Tax=unclassified Beijerinckia TaxID=2638183 RepID=UPI0008991B3D|nr:MULTISPECIES: MFS transporter [unclassified Beijerinckia]MDH7794604.1 CP family cyanate transporter-like MFS transporter [Beijerinckia sp. GAS462]SEB68219.1 MFS transporter, CP family, cyanate transporter [Beijerinckia sp. 28-YEA-48]